MRIFTPFLLCLHLALAQQYRIIDLLSSSDFVLHGLQLYPNDFDNDDAQCTDQHIIKANYDGFSLPRDFKEKIGIFVRLMGVGNSDSGVIFSFGDPIVSVALDFIKKSLIIDGGPLVGRAIYTLPSQISSNPSFLDISLVIISKDSNIGAKEYLQLYANDVLLTSDAVPSALILHLTSSRDFLYRHGLALGTITSPSSATSFVQSSLRANIALFMLAMDWPFDHPPSILQLQIEALHNVHAPVPEIAYVQQRPSGDVFIGQEVLFTALYNELHDTRARIVVFGVSPEMCNASECGDTIFDSYTDNTTTIETPPTTSTLTAAVHFTQAGKFLIRAMVSHGDGLVDSQDMTILVRKIGDVLLTAPCCATTPYITALQLGRPIDQTTFRGDAVYKGATELGWIDAKYGLYGEDMESERLFDYSILAPPQQQIPFKIITCMDTRLAGAGSPVVYGLTSNTADVSGHNKALTYVPIAFPWANVSEVECNAHFSRWQDSSAYARYTDDGSLCSVGCTQVGTQQLIQATGAFDQYNQALISNSYGALSLSPHVTVLPEVLVGKSPAAVTQSDSPTSYYSVPARQAVAAQPGPLPWMYIVLSPLAYHQNPPHRAWSAGMSSGSAHITTCYPSMYYSVHETGHRLGFKHSNIYKLDSATAAPSDPLGPGSFVNDAYSDRLDVMGCCKGDYGLYHRTLAGWLYGSGRMFMSHDDVINQQNMHSILMWPFDRPESSKNKDRFLSISVRKSADEILLLGYRSTSHYQDSGSGVEKEIPAEEARQNVKGLQVEYLKRNGSVWSQRGLIDFNVLTGDWPEALPSFGREFPQKSHFALLKEGQSWYDAASKLLIQAVRIRECPHDSDAAMPHSSYSAFNYFGFRGEWPFQENPQRADYSGHKLLDCLSMVIKTQASQPPSQPLQVDMIVFSAVADRSSVHLTPYEEVGHPVSSRKLRSLLQQQSAQSQGECITSQQDRSLYAFSLSWSISANAIASLICKDSLNYTLYSLDATDFMYNNSYIGDERTIGVSLDIASASLPARIFVLGEDGRHAVYTLEEYQINGNRTRIKVTSKHYGMLSHSYSTAILDPSREDCGKFVGLKPKQDDTTQGMIVAVSVLSCAVLAMVGGWSLWLVTKVVSRPIVGVERHVIEKTLMQSENHQDDGHRVQSDSVLRKRTNNQLCIK